MNPKAITHNASTDFQVGQNTLVLMLKEELTTPLEAEVISPDILGALNSEEIRTLPVYLGNRKHQLGDFFEVVGEKSIDLELFGNLNRVKWIGKQMTRGSIVVHGSTGMHLGSGMSGGTITVFGDSADWLGAEMVGGLIHVHGNAGGQVGSAYRRSQIGMRGGEIIVERSAGNEVGRRMQDGMIIIHEHVGDFAGIEMNGGSLFLLGSVGIRTGAWMSKGTIVTYKPIVLLPTFLRGETYAADHIQTYLKRLEEQGIAMPEKAWDSLYQCFTGDTSGEGNGEILICQTPAAADIPTVAAHPGSGNQACN
ncbi:MAG: formylmethanofuran dehydrogenase subunit C [Anaerolineaceae bacterium]|nr:formylmethanofuran dehydrogenase subunit C [Anaerolineaceae bacterium]